MFMERIWRFLSLGMAVAFNFLYLSGIASLFRIQISNRIPVLSGQDNRSYNVLDILVSLVISYMTITFLPTFVTNSVIILKESTMN